MGSEKDGWLPLARPARLFGGAGLTPPHVQILPVLNLTSSILGAGLMSPPYAVVEAGLAAGLVALVAVAAVVDWSVLLLIRCGRRAGARSYPELMRPCRSSLPSAACERV